MNVAIDTSALLAVIIGEPERDSIVHLTAGATLICPGSISWEIGNAFSAMLKRRRIAIEEARKGFDAFRRIQLRVVPIDLDSALTLSAQVGMYAYDGYILECALRNKAPLLTLDRALQKAARTLGLEILEA